MTHSRSINITSEDNNSSQSSIPEHTLVIKKLINSFLLQLLVKNLYLKVYFTTELNDLP